ncbi:hypothetical protein N7519_008658 [Penicillium mononematosum]|uniref:uncharacterized protein n=1 Tax=Penicillium mononematosum TaxID=268346 RepID=UPI002547DDCD|nr:uncharacterized protein N7519_008658 [Penicillium mononematosum]KAJ6178197.1 hypothetical protein N7519_008658 [Penicillium mononematosum]
MQVPTVTLEDLQAFQSKHFPGQQLAAFSQENDETTDEDLGYYPDGVKRTLTDEQIRIFRHSEIHALLRERQLQADEAQYQARMQSSPDDGSEGPSAPEKRPLDAEPQTQGGDRKRSHSRKGSRKHIPEDKPSKLLDYGDDSDQTQTARPPVSHQGRRIISYDD